MLIPDNNFHTVDGKRLPRVTAITGLWPKGYGFHSWLGNAASLREADAIKNEAARRGSLVHEMVADLLAGGSVQYDPGLDHVWPYLEGFMNFYEDHSPKPKLIEHFLHSSALMTAGTPDLIDADNNIWDWKTGNGLYYSHELQLYAYRLMATEYLGEKVNKAYLVQLGTRHKRGYTVKEVKTPMKDLKRDWNICYRLFEKEIGLEPRDKEYRDEIRLTLD